ncbi:cyanophycinase [Thalassotalea maritima]|uniref:cyanophycinase n=1 Tax=Thalassotalea maritima TaxID=3242416 RepID=UPI00352790BF
MLRHTLSSMKFFELKSLLKPISTVASGIVFCALFATVSPVYSQSKTTDEKRLSKLFLVGGGLKTCSSFNQSQCLNGAMIKGGKSESRYQVSKQQLSLLANHQANFSDAEFHALMTVLTNISQIAKQQVLSKSKLRELIRIYDRNQVIKNLNDFKYFLLHDLLEVRVAESEQRVIEKVDLASSKDVFSKELYYAFVNHAKNNSDTDKPYVVVLTASARDPFEAADFYQQVFAQAGANSEWLPLDATLNKAWQQKADNADICLELDNIRLRENGSTNRQSVYRDLYLKQQQACEDKRLILNKIANADGLFINGGDQSLTRKAFLNDDGSDNEVLALIKQKLNQGHFVVGGTSAGTAVMSGGQYRGKPTVMISNGRSETALQRGAKADVLPIEGCQKTNTCDDNLLNTDLTYHSQGGLGLVNFAIMDTHFSERGRQGRVAILAEQTQASFVLGVDEATAVVIDWPSMNGVTKEHAIDFSVVGAKGVFVLQPKAARKAMIHYLTRGDTATIRGDDIEVKFNKSPSDLNINVTPQRNDVFAGDNFKLFAQKVCHQAKRAMQASYQWQDKRYHISLHHSDNTKVYFGQSVYQDKPYLYCSYSNLEFHY